MPRHRRQRGVRLLQPRSTVAPAANRCRVNRYRRSRTARSISTTLMNVNGGLLHAATDMDEHRRQLGEAVRDPKANDEKSRRFIEAFVWPFGRDAAATSLLAEAIEDL